ncbi:flagellar hook-associated protein FlgK [Tissierella sp.]|uniref:flagellar hook-associated protein FlgK n=1 Tax=Tissierella sp. TaxID=41274 RepID=UPI0028606673|nr:flagellar hook-associated protein FlgK [Tissierella sp.]MDR7856922.1 flagellar hook-associated protein FlgK [Tissierella sp.]
MIFGFNSAVRGLLASQRALYTTNHNIDNASTKGYSRQQIDQKATNPFLMPGIGFLGTGTEIYNVQRVRDSFVDFKYWNEMAPMGEWEVKKNALTEMEKLMGEPSNSSFRQYMDDFYSSLDEMSKNPSDIAYREPVRENAIAFTKHVQETIKRLRDVKKETEYEIETKVKYVNSLSERIAGLNKQIYSQEIDGKQANDLRDRRELLVDELSKIVNVRVNESSDGKYEISVNGISIVDHMNTNKMFLKKTTVGVEDTYDILWENGGDANPKSGELKGLLDMIQGDGQGNTYRGIPYYMEQLNDFAKGFADKFNELHRKGYGIGESRGAGVDGIDFFTYTSDEEAAATLGVNQDIIDDIKKIAAASISGGAAEDNGNLLALVKQRESRDFFSGAVSQGTPDDFIKAMLSSMAVDSLQSKRLYATQELMQKNVETKRASISGVSLEEEMADMVKFQHVYVAASKMISTMDALLDITVNRLGMVGR